MLKQCYLETKINKYQSKNIYSIKISKKPRDKLTVDPRGLKTEAECSKQTEELTELNLLDPFGKAEGPKVTFYFLFKAINSFFLQLHSL